MDIDKSKYFETTGKDLDLSNFINEVVGAGKYFSGSIYYDCTMNNYCLFYSVNKEKIKYILNELDTTKEVKLEIYAHANNSEEIQPENYWPKFKL